LVGAVTGNTTGSHKGNVLANDNDVMINAATKQIGFAGANIVGTLTGSVTGSAATAADAGTLNGLEGSATVPGSPYPQWPVRNSAAATYWPINL
jgi:hypothetical protein